MSDFRTIEEFQRHQEETAIPKLRWWQVQALAADCPNDQDLGAEIRKLTNK